MGRSKQKECICFLCFLCRVLGSCVQDSRLDQFLFSTERLPHSALVSPGSFSFDLDYYLLYQRECEFDVRKDWLL